MNEEIMNCIMNNNDFKIGNRGCLSRIRCLNIYHLLTSVIDLGIEGDIVELGCFKGYTAMLMQKILDHSSSSKIIHVYDSFEGFPPPTENDGTQTNTKFAFHEGGMRSSIDDLKQEFSKHNIVLPTIHKGFFKDISPDQLPEKIAFAHLDGDFYESIVDSFNLIYDRLSDDAVVVIDDYGWDQLPGVKLACDDFTRKTGIQVHNISVPIDVENFGHNSQAYFRMHAHNRIIRSYKNNGFCVVPKMIKEVEANELRTKFYSVFNKNKDIVGHGKIDQLRNIANQDGVNVIKQKAMYSMCHFYRQDHTFKKMCLDNRILKIVKSILGTDDIQLFDQQLLYKPAIIGEAVDYHQDNNYWGCSNVEDVVSVWIALTPATIENGCLWVVPGTHDKSISANNSEIYGYRIDCTENEKPLQMNPGDAVFMNSLIVHGTKENKSNLDRIGLEMAWVRNNAQTKNNTPIRNDTFRIPKDSNIDKFNPRLNNKTIKLA